MNDDNVIPFRPRESWLEPGDRSLQFHIQSDLSAEEAKMLKAIDDMGEAQINTVYEAAGDDAPFEGNVGELERLLRLTVVKDPEKFRNGGFSMLDPHGHKQTIRFYGRQLVECLGCGVTSPCVYVICHNAFVYECRSCRKIFWNTLKLGQQILKVQS